MSMYNAWGGRNIVFVGGKEKAIRRTIGFRARLGGKIENGKEKRQRRRRRKRKKRRRRKCG